MIPAIGHLALILSFFMAIMLASSPLVSRFSNERQVQYYSHLVILGAWLSLSAAFGILLYSHIISDFSVLNVVTNSHRSKPLLYKISGVWGNHEGSMLLWVWLLVSFTTAFAWINPIAVQMKTVILSIQGMLAAGFLAFILFTSNPFVRVFPPAREGQGLNPLLQDIGLAIHPPCLYLGYVGFSLIFSAAIAALIYGKVEEHWARILKPWVMVSWSFLTVGIALGSWWAYRELGWGGFWFWDPVENSSLMPWLTGTALLHSLIVVAKRGQLQSWTLLLAIMTFALSLLGTFLVRSGVLTSVHSFTNDPERGFFILVFLTVIVGVSLTLFALRAHRLQSVNGGFSPISRESAILVNNLIFTVASFTILLGTLYPIFYELLTGAKLSIGTPYFAATFIPITLPLLGLAAIGSLLKWQNDRVAFRKHRTPVLISITASILSSQLIIGAPWLFPVAIGLATWLISAMLQEWVVRIKLSRPLPGSFYAMLLAHIGIGITVIGIAVATAGFKETTRAMKPGDNVEIAGYRLIFKGMTYHKGANYVARTGSIYVETMQGNEVVTLFPERRFYPVEKNQTSESALHTTVFSDLYTAMGELEDADHVTIRVYYRPFISWIWAGALLMAIGGMIGVKGRKR